MPITSASIPVLEQLIRKVVTRLETVNTAGGYFYTITNVVRPLRRNDYSPVDGLAVVQLGPISQTQPEIDMDGLKVSREQVIEIDVFIEPSDTSTTPYDSLRAKALAEIERAFAVDFYPTSGIGPFEGTASNAYMQAPQLIDDAQMSGVRINLAVRYRHLDTDPYTPL